MDRGFLRFLVSADNALPQGQWVAELTPELLSWLGSVDDELRDGFAYPILAAWIERGEYPPDELRAMARRMVENLESGLGEAGTDSVFLRTFSALILMEIVAYDNASPFLDADEVLDLFERGLSYLRREQDLRGWVPGPGWAHAIAHVADLLMMLARSRHLGAPELERLLDAVADKLLAPAEAVYLHHEDERLAYTTLNVLRRGLVGRDFLTAWAGRFERPPGHDSWRPVYADPGLAAARMNVTSFLRSLYFQLLLTAEPPPGRAGTLDALVASLRHMDIGFYELN
ncbi:MAG TPA: DUF2785 domain-containing protein [Actinomycetota bacterium]|nr:DUF2785 domain-containing protein [Actinomycetota bacterium]